MVMDIDGEEIVDAPEIAERLGLGDDAADPRLIVTHFGLGYRWIAGDDQPRGISLSS